MGLGVPLGVGVPVGVGSGVDAGATGTRWLTTLSGAGVTGGSGFGAIANRRTGAFVAIGLGADVEAGVLTAGVGVGGAARVMAPTCARSCLCTLRLAAAWILTPKPPRTRMAATSPER